MLSVSLQIPHHLAMSVAQLERPSIPACPTSLDQVDLHVTLASPEMSLDLVDSDVMTASPEMSQGRVDSDVMTASPEMSQG